MVSTRILKLHKELVSGDYRTKRAYLGGQGNDTTFESIFSEIAHAYIEDKAPALKMYEQGFQVVERNEDDTKAVGVIGYSINNMEVFAPVFFLKGEIKGHELLYLADQDLFVPMKEAWVNEILQRKAIQIGDTTARKAKGLLPPELEVLRSPTFKTGGYTPYWLRSGLGAFAKIGGRTKAATLTNLYDLITDYKLTFEPTQYFKYAGEKGYTKVAALVDNDPVVAKAWKSEYQKMIKIYREKQAAKHSIINRMARRTERLLPKLTKDAGVRVISYSMSITSGVPLDISDEEREDMVRKGYLVQDERPANKVSKVLEVNRHSSISNPTDTGIYDVIMSDNSTKKFVILFPKDSNYDRENFPGNDMSARDRKNIESRITRPIILVDPENSDNTITDDLSSRDVFTTKKYPGEEYLDWLEDQDKITDIMPNESWDSVTLLLNDRFGVYRKSGALSPTADKHILTCDMDMCNDTIRRIVISDAEGSRFRERDNSLQVPKNTRILQVYRKGTHSLPPDKTPAKDPLATLSAKGNPVSQYSMKTASMPGCEEIKLLVRDGECSINNQPAMARFDGFSKLITDYGLTERDAKTVMKTAETSPANVHRFILKWAADGPSNVGEEYRSIPVPDTESIGNNDGLPFFNSKALPGQNGSMDIRLTTTTPREQDPYNYDADTVSPQGDAQAISQAAAQGQKEVLDVSMLKQLLTNTDTENQISKLTTQFIKGMDAAGRLLFLFYWKGDQFEELYGPRNLPELEGSIRKNFEVAGDIVLFLKRNKVSSADMVGDMNVDLSDNED